MRICVVLPLPSVPSNVMNRPRVCSGARWSVIDRMQQRLEIFPSLTPCNLIVLAKQIGRVISHHEWDIVPLLPLAPHSGDALLGVEQGFHCSGAEGTDGLRLNGHELAIKELPTRLHLIRERGSVFRRPAFNDVTDVNIRTRNRDAFLGGSVVDHLSEQLTGPAYKGQTRLVLIRSGPFPYKDQPGPFVT